MNACFMDLVCHEYRMKSVAYWLYRSSSLSLSSSFPLCSMESNVRLLLAVPPSDSEVGGTVGNRGNNAGQEG